MSKTLDINPLLYQSPLFWEGFLQDFVIWLQEFAPTGTKGPKQWITDTEQVQKSM